MSNKKQQIEAFLNKPTKYGIEVHYKESLPKELQSKKVIFFEIKAPSLYILQESALILEGIPKEVREELKEGKNPEGALKYIDEVVEIFCLVSWGRRKKIPSWYKPFIKENVTAQELYNMYFETSVKMQPGFFLNCFQVVEVSLLN